jgi:pheromone shutdown-related protein TraB
MTDGVAPDAETGAGGEVTVVGTAHISQESVTEVEDTIVAEDPDVVAVELDEGRYRQMQGEAPEDLDASDLLRGNTVFQLLAYWLLSYVQTRLGERFDIQPGADMLAAVETAESLGIEVALVDRDIQTTIARFWQRLTLWEKLKLVGSLVGALVGVGIGEGEDVEMEELTDGDVVSAMLEEFRRFSPGGAEALIDERDAFIAHHLVGLRDAGQNVVAVVGAGHREGIEEYLAHPERLPPLESLQGTAESRGVPWLKLFGYAVSLGFLAFFVLLAMAGVNDRVLLEVFAAWFVVNGVCAAGLAKLAGARWSSAGVGGAVAWLTSVNPLLAPGWFAGYMELRHTPVNVGDIATLNDLLADETRPIRAIVSDMLDVPLFRLMMVVALTNVGSFVASVLFAVSVLPLLGPEVVGGCTAQRAFLGIDLSGVECTTNLMMDGARESARAILGVLR